MQVGKSRVWLESGAQPHELADLGWLAFIGAATPDEVGGESYTALRLLYQPITEAAGFRPVNPDPRGPDMGQVMTFGRTQQSFLPPPFKPTSTGAGLLDLGTDDPEVAQRAADLRLLRALVSEVRELRGEEYDAFEGMLFKLEDPDRRYETLTKKQRGWATSVAEREGIDWATSEDISARNAAVPRGREVQMAFDVDKRPLAPPARARGSASPFVFDAHLLAPPDAMPAPTLSTVAGALELARDFPEGPVKERAVGRLGPLLSKLALADGQPEEEGHWIPAEGVESIAGAIHSRPPSLPPILEAAQPGPGERTRRRVRSPRA